MDKRYQVFVSSTFTDLEKERHGIMQALMKLDCIPAGMELFPAADEEQRAFIQKIIDDCDYYLLIVGGRYGSTTAEGISFTEKEYDYAVSKGIYVVAILHADPDQLPVAKSEIDAAARKKLTAFREKASRGRLVKKWTTEADLLQEVTLSLIHAIKVHPRVGWVRGDTIADNEAKTQIITLQRKLDKQSKQLEDYKERDKKTESDLASGSDEFTIPGRYSMWVGGGDERIRHEVSIEATISWDGLVKFIRNRGLIQWSLSELRREITVAIKTRLPKEICEGRLDEIGIDNSYFHAVVTQLNALGLIVRKSNNWEFSAKGLEYANRLLAVKKGEQLGESSNTFDVSGEIYESVPEPEPDFAMIFGHLNH